ncbi:MAG: glycosyltransferase family 2 protein [Bacteroidales bacterium]|nr:glycosyltransferase family 2 protein [Bacteroidales bacterium]
MVKVSVVILNWNGKKFLEKFLPGVIEHSKNYADIIIADNASSDDSVEFLTANFPEIRIIQNETNGGFAKGYNDALSQVNSEYYVLLNSDIEVTANWIKPVIDLMEKDRQIAACQPKLLAFYKRSHFEYAGAAGGFIDRFGYPFCRGRIFQEIEEDRGQYDNEAEVFWATGACLFVRAELYHRFGGFDNDFFAHMEEIDLCWRLKNAGYKIMYCPDAVVYHVGGGTLPKKSSLKTYLNFRNNLTLIFKNIPSGKIFQTFITRWALDWVAALKFLAAGGLADFLAVLRAHWFFIFNVRSQLSKRRKLTQSEVSGVYKRNLVVDHYVRKKKRFSDLNQADFTQ